MRGLVSLLVDAGLAVVRKTHLGALVYPGFWATKKLNAYRGGPDRAVVERDIRSSGNPLVRWLLKTERAIGAPLAFGVRCVVVARRPHLIGSRPRTASVVLERDRPRRRVRRADVVRHVAAALDRHCGPSVQRKGVGPRLKRMRQLNSHPEARRQGHVRQRPGDTVIRSRLARDVVERGRERCRRRNTKCLAIRGFV